MIPKFKAWDSYNEQLVDVLSIDFEDKVAYVEQANGDRYDIHFDNLQFMLSSGVKDDNEIEVFAGYIVHVIDSQQINQIDENGAYIDAFFEELDEIDTVVFEDGCFTLKQTGLNVSICESVESFKVIGTIYENPEFLEARE